MRGMPPESARPNRLVRRAASLILPLTLVACDGGSGPESPEPDHDLVFEGVLDNVPELLRQDASTGEVTRMLPAGTVVMDPQPSPDGARIAFVVADYGQATGDVYVMNRDGSGIMRLTHAPELDDQPAWSPDGTRIAFRSYRDGREGDIWVMGDDGSDPVNLTPDPLPGVPDERAPHWSPDGTRIAYASNVGGTMDVWTMAPDGSDKRRITDTPEYETEPIWSPDGATIAFRKNFTGDTDLYLVPAAGGAQTPLALPGYQRMAAWTPDGGSLVFVGQPTLQDRPDLYRVRRDGQGLEPLVTDAVPGGSVNPAFLPR